MQKRNNGIQSTLAYLSSVFAGQATVQPPRDAPNIFLRQTGRVCPETAPLAPDNNPINYNK